MLQSLAQPGAVGYVTFGSRAQILHGSHPPLPPSAHVREMADPDGLILIRPGGRTSVLYTHHAYAVLAVDARAGLRLYNPMGNNLELAFDHTGASLWRQGSARFWLEPCYVPALVHQVAMCWTSRPSGSLP